MCGFWTSSASSIYFYLLVFLYMLKFKFGTNGDPSVDRYCFKLSSLFLDFHAML